MTNESPVCPAMARRILNQLYPGTVRDSLQALGVQRLPGMVVRIDPWTDWHLRNVAQFRATPADLFKMPVEVNESLPPGMMQFGFTTEGGPFVLHDFVRLHGAPEHATWKREP